MTERKFCQNSESGWLSNAWQLSFIWNLVVFDHAFLFNWPCTILYSFADPVTRSFNIPLSKFLHRAGKLIISHHFVYGINQSWLIVGLHPPGIFIDYGMQSHGTYIWIKLFHRFLKLPSWDGNIFLWIWYEISRRTAFFREPPPSSAEDVISKDCACTLIRYMVFVANQDFDYLKV